jgi:hypothetical protein
MRKKTTMRGIRCNEDDDRPLSPTSRGHQTRGNFPCCFARFLSSGVPERAPEGWGWPGLAGWMKAQIWAKTRNRGHDWTVFRRPDEKKAAGGLAGTMAGGALISHGVMNPAQELCSFH